MDLSSQRAIELEKKYGSFNFAPLPVVFSRGSGALLYDLAGKPYLDFVSGFSALNQGHCHSRIVRAIQEQAERLTLLSRALYSDQFGLFAEYCTKLFGYERVLVMNTGVEAFETSLKIARKWGHTVKGVPPGTARVIVCGGNFHGRTLTAMSASSKEKDYGVFGPVNPGFVHVPFGDLTALSAALQDPSIAAFLVEPIQGEGGVVVPPDGYLAAAASLCNSANVLLIADEVQTGIGRTGKLLCSEWDGVKPDITLLGKALSGGTMPVSAVLARSELMAMLQPGDHGSTFGGSPLACHVALESLRVVVEEELVEKSRRLGELFRAAVRDLGSPLIKEVRGRGLLNGIVFDFGGSDAQDLALSEELLACGLVAKSTRTNVFRFAPPLVITEKQLLEAVAILGRVLARYTAPAAH